MCAKAIPTPFDFDQFSEKSPFKPDSDAVSAVDSSESDHSALLEAQKALADELVREAEAEAKLRKMKVDAARIAVAQAAHKASSQSSTRSRTRINIVPLLDEVAPVKPMAPTIIFPTPPVPETVSEGGVEDTDIAGDSRMLESELGSMMDKSPDKVFTEAELRRFNEVQEPREDFPRVEVPNQSQATAGFVNPQVDIQKLESLAQRRHDEVLQAARESEALMLFEAQQRHEYLMSEQRNEFITAETRERQKLEAQQNELVFNALEHEKVLNTIQEEQQRRLQKALDEGHDAANQLASSAKLAAAHVEVKCEQVTSERLVMMQNEFQEERAKAEQFANHIRQAAAKAELETQQFVLQQAAEREALVLREAERRELLLRQ